MNSKLPKLLNQYSKIRTERQSIQDAADKISAEKEHALSVAIEKLNVRYSKRISAIVKRKSKLAKQMEVLLEAVYHIDADIASDMALGKEVSLSPPTLVDNNQPLDQNEQTI